MIRKPLVIINGRVQELPVGDSIETAEEVMFSKRVDFINDNLLYKAESAAGTLDSSPLWRISKVVIENDGDVIETWAEGTASFDKIWTNRLSYTYS